MCEGVTGCGCGVCEGVMVGCRGGLKCDGGKCCTLHAVQACQSCYRAWALHY